MYTHISLLAKRINSTIFVCGHENITYFFTKTRCANRPRVVIVQNTIALNSFTGLYVDLLRASSQTTHFCYTRPIDFRYFLNELGQENNSVVHRDSASRTDLKFFCLTEIFLPWLTPGYFIQFFSHAGGK